MRYFRHISKEQAEKIFLKKPGSFNKNTDLDILRYAVGPLLYIPAVNRKVLNKLSDFKIDSMSSVTICLEDSVGNNGETEAIRNMEETLEKINTGIHENSEFKDNLPLIFIRPKNLEQMEKFKDVLQKHKNILTGIVIPKADSIILENFINKLDEYGCENFYVMPIIETIEFTNTLSKEKALKDFFDTAVRFKERILNIRIGVTDILGSYGLRRNKTLTIYDNIVFNNFSYDMLSVFGGRKEIDIPISGGVSEFYNLKNKEILKAYFREIDIDVMNGFIGKTVIHPLQALCYQAKMAVSYEDYEDALNIIKSREKVSGVSAGYRKERMNETNPHMKWAEKILKLAEIYGVLKEGKDFNELLEF